MQQMKQATVASFFFLKISEQAKASNVFCVCLCTVLT